MHTLKACTIEAMKTYLYGGEDVISRVADWT